MCRFPTLYLLNFVGLTFDFTIKRIQWQFYHIYTISNGRANIFLIFAINLNYSTVNARLSSTNWVGSSAAFNPLRFLIKSWKFICTSSKKFQDWKLQMSWPYTQCYRRANLRYLLCFIFWFLMNLWHKNRPILKCVNIFIKLKCIKPSKWQFLYVYQNHQNVPFL